MRPRSCFLSVLLFAALAGCDKAPDEFESIRADACAGRYALAEPRLRAYRGPHESRAGLFLGKIAMARGDMDTAREEFQRVIDSYPQSGESHKSKYKLAVIDMLEGNRAAARGQFAALADNPDGPLAPEAAAMAEFLDE